MTGGLRCFGNKVTGCCVLRLLEAKVPEMPARTCTSTIICMEEDASCLKTISGGGECIKIRNMSVTQSR
jgi:hypothetical protein